MTQISALLEAGQTYSYEFFPPKDDAQAQALDRTIGELALTDPDFISVPYGALGSTRSVTKNIAIANNRRWSFPTMAHLTCVGQSKTDLRALLGEYSEAGLENILALRGDGTEPGDFAHALDLVELIKDNHPEMSVGVAAHPEVHPNSTSRAQDRQYLAAKLEVADFGVTQFFFDPSAYQRMVDELDALGCRKPIIPGIMLFSSASGLERMARLNNTSLPTFLTERLVTLQTPEDTSKLAVETAAKLIDDLSAYKLPGVHIYTLNRSQPALELRALLS